MTLSLVAHDVNAKIRAMIKKFKRFIFLLLKVINMNNFFLFLHFKKYTNTIPK